MGNCQAVDAAALVIQHPTGKIERMYWSISASEVMKMNPGHYVSLIIPLPDDNPDRTVRFTRVKLLRPTDTLVLGRAYRLVTSQEVMKVLRAKRHAKMKQEQAESVVQNSSSSGGVETASDLENTTHKEIQERSLSQRSRSASIFANSRSKSWRPSLQSISEATSR